MEYAEDPRIRPSSGLLRRSLAIETSSDPETEGSILPRTAESVCNHKAVALFPFREAQKAEKEVD